MPSEGPPEQHLPDLFEIYIGSSRGVSYGAWWDGRVVMYESFGPDYAGCEQSALTPSRAQWQRFWRSMDGLGVWKWDERYEPGEPFEPGRAVSACVHWSFTLSHAGHTASSSGNGCGPGSGDLDDSPAFTAFLQAASRLLGGRPFA